MKIETVLYKDILMNKILYRPFQNKDADAVSDIFKENCGYHAPLSYMENLIYESMIYPTNVYVACNDQSEVVAYAVKGMRSKPVDNPFQDELCSSKLDIVQRKDVLTYLQAEIRGNFKPAPSTKEADAVLIKNIKKSKGLSR
jgi:hypothetical protein